MPVQVKACSSPSLPFPYPVPYLFLQAAYGIPDCPTAPAACPYHFDPQAPYDENTFMGAVRAAVRSFRRANPKVRIHRLRQLHQTKQPSGIVKPSLRICPGGAGASKGSIVDALPQYLLQRRGQIQGVKFYMVS